MLIVLLLTAAFLHAWYADWAFRQSISNLRASGGDLTNFPLAIVISNHKYLQYLASSNGNDIMFTDLDDNKLAHEIEYFNQSTGTLHAWVNIPVLDSSEDRSNAVYMYYDISQSGSQQNPAGVWQIGEYLGVYHLGGNSNDSSVNSNHPSGATGIKQTNGMIGQAYEFNNGYIEYPYNSCLNTGTAVTISAWVQLKSLGMYHTFISRHRGAVNNNYYFMVYNSDKALGAVYNTGTQYYIYGQSAFQAADLNTWIYLVYTDDGNNRHIYSNGVYFDGTTGGANPHTIGTDSEELTIGSDSDAGRGRRMYGVLDEVRIEKTARSSGWIITSYSNQANPTAFRSLGAYESGSRGIQIGGTVSGDISSGVFIRITGAVNYQTNTDGVGNWSAYVPADVSCIITIESNGYISVPSSYTASPASTTLTYNFTLSKGYTISGQVLDKTSSGLNGITVKLSGSMSGTTVSGNSGGFSFAVSNGEYYLDANGNGYQNIAAPSRISILNSDSTANIIRLVGIYSLSGTVYERITGVNSRIAKHTWVQLEGDSTASNKTGDNGSFCFLVPEGIYYLSALSNGYLSNPEKKLFVVHSAISNITFTLEKFIFFVSGNIRDRYGDPYKDVPVMLDDNYNNIEYTDNNGHYSFTVYSGEHVITVSNSGYRLEFASTNLQIKNTNCTDVNFTILGSAIPEQNNPVNFQIPRIIYLNHEQKIPAAIYISEKGIHECRIGIYSLDGQRLETIFKGKLQQGFYPLSVQNPGKLPKGIYIFMVQIQKDNVWKRYCQIISVIR